MYNIFNPNLYAVGKVWLRLLGTWHDGDSSEKWDPVQSTLMQVWNNEIKFYSKLKFGCCNFRGLSNQNYFHDILDDVTALKSQFPLTQDCGNIQCLDCFIGLMYKVLS